MRDSLDVKFTEILNDESKPYGDRGDCLAGVVLANGILPNTLRTAIEGIRACEALGSGKDGTLTAFWRRVCEDSWDDHNGLPEFVLTGYFEDRSVLRNPEYVDWKILDHISHSRLHEAQQAINSGRVDEVRAMLSVRPEV